MQKKIVILFINYKDGHASVCHRNYEPGDIISREIITLLNFHSVCQNENTLLLDFLA